VCLSARSFYAENKNEQLLEGLQKRVFWKVCPSTVFGAKEQTHGTTSCPYVRLHHGKLRDFLARSRFVREERLSFFQTALAHELTGKHFLGIGSKALAPRHLHDAVRSYRVWGATAKADRLVAELRLV